MLIQETLKEAFSAIKKIASGVKEKFVEVHGEINYSISNKDLVPHIVGKVAKSLCRQR